jgi:TPR repeat protein
LQNLLRAAERGVADAQLNLGRRYEEGVHVAQDLVEAARLLWLAAAQGDADAPALLQALAGERAYVAACCSGCGATRK